MTTRAQQNEQRDQRILIATLIGVAVAIIGLGYQMALPDPNPYVGCSIMLVGVGFLLWALWEARWKTAPKIVLSLILLGVYLIPSFFLVTARAVFEPHVTSAIISTIAPGKAAATQGVRFQLWADVINDGDRSGLIREWHLTLTFPDGTIKEGQPMYGQEARDADGQLMNTDSLEDKTENSPIVRHAHPKGFLFFYFSALDYSVAKDDRTMVDLWLIDEKGQPFHAKRKTIADIRNNMPD